MFIECSWLRFSLGRSIVSAIIILGLNSTSANALNRIYFTPGSQSIQVGSEVTLDIMMDFEDVTVGGGLEVTYSSGLTFLSFDFNPTFTANFGLLGPDPGSVAEALDIAFGWLIFTGIGGETGVHNVGQLTFSASGPGPVEIVMSDVSGTAAGPYYGPASLSSPLPVDFGSATLDIIISPIPELRSGILLGMGLLGLSWAGGGTGRKSRIENSLDCQPGKPSITSPVHGFGILA